MRRGRRSVFFAVAEVPDLIADRCSAFKLKCFRRFDHLAFQFGDAGTDLGKDILRDEDVQDIGSFLGDLLSF